MACIELVPAEDRSDVVTNKQELYFLHWRQHPKLIRTLPHNKLTPCTSLSNNSGRSTTTQYPTNRVTPTLV